MADKTDLRALIDGHAGVRIFQGEVYCDPCGKKLSSSSPSLEPSKSGGTPSTTPTTSVTPSAPLSACRALLAYVDGEQQRDSDAEHERERDADEPRPEWITELVAHVRRAADAAERIAERVYSHQREPEPKPECDSAGERDADSEFDAIRRPSTTWPTPPWRAYRLGWDAGFAAGGHRSQ